MGHTVFMSSHIFEEIEMSCDRVALIKGGKDRRGLLLWTISGIIETRRLRWNFKDEESFRKFVSRAYAISNVKTGAAAGHCGNSRLADRAADV